MDPSSGLLVPTTPQTAANHQFLTDVFTYNHPPYAEMIAGAISALKEKGGSSRQAISKHMEQAYKDQLPPTHSTLLTHHLRRLKNDGHLLMHKHSYLLPGSIPSPTVPSPVPGDSVGSPARKRGRPVKVKSPDVPITDSDLAIVDSEAEAAIAVPDKKLDVPSMDTGVADAVSSPNRKSGRVKKTKLVVGVMDSEKKKRGRPGRPAKIPQSMPVMIPYLSDDVAVAPSPRRRGRPKRGGPSQANVTTAAASNGSGVVSGKRRRGRPARPFGTKKGIGRFVGRPRKYNALPKVPSPGQPLWMVDYGYVKSKIDNIQSRIKQALNLLKPQFINENTVTIAAALRDLEEISTVDLIGAPFNVSRDEQPLQQEALNVDPVQGPVA